MENQRTKNSKNRNQNKTNNNNNNNNQIERYKHLNKYLKDKFGERTLKICIDGGFTCPNRDGKVGTDGCIFCSAKGSGDHIHFEANITNQVQNYFKSYKAERANKFIAYFQNFTNTYDTLENLKSKYDAALISNKIVALAIATRPDCITDDICKLIASYKDKVYVWVELGFQTSNDETGKLINRGYTSKQFENAVNLLNKYKIDIVTHIMIGLPNETNIDIKNTIKYLNTLNIQGLKIHSTYVLKDTKLGDMYEEGIYTPITLEYYLNTLVYIITHINPNIIIHRITGDAPKDLLLAPEWNSHKKLVLNGFDRILREKNLHQGQYYNSNS